MRRKLLLLSTAVCAGLPLSALSDDKPVETYQPWAAKNKTIQEPLGGLKGDAARGRKLAIDGGKGNCLACHIMPVPEEEFHGEIGPPLTKIGKRFDEAKLRMRIVNIQTIIPDSLMPPFYKNPAELNRVAEKYKGRTILTAQEVEDVVAYLMTLK